MNPTLVLGAGGQVGRALLAELGDRAVGWDQADADFSRPQELAKLVLEFEPSAVLNAAAYTAVDAAEKDEALATLVNGESPGRLADVCRELKIPLVHYSTDYVFPGSGTRPWTEEDQTGPLNAYGRSKLLGEQRVAAAGGRYLIFRTSWVYDAEGQNFVRTMLRLGAEREELRVVNDQFGAPTYAPALAHATLEALHAARSGAEFPSGIYHLCSSGETNWHAFAEAIFENARRAGVPLRVKTVRGIPSAEYPTPAKRPSNSRLSTAKIASWLGVQMGPWAQDLSRCIEGRVRPTE